MTSTAARIIAVIGLIASIIGIFVFVTGKESIPEIIASPTPRTSGEVAVYSSNAGGVTSTPTPERQLLDPTNTPPAPTPTPVPLQPTQHIPKKAAPGIYPLNWIIRRGDFIVTINDIEVLNTGQLKVNITYRNNDTREREISCSPDNNDADGYITLADGTRLFPAETACTSKRGWSTLLKSGETVDGWAIFEPLEDATQPFDLEWYGIGSASGIVLLP